MVFEIRNGNRVILFCTHNCNSLTRALLLLFNVFTKSDCVTNYKIVQ